MVATKTRLESRIKKWKPLNVLFFFILGQRPRDWGVSRRVPGCMHCGCELQLHLPRRRYRSALLLVCDVSQPAMLGKDRVDRYVSIRPTPFVAVARVHWAAPPRPTTATTTTTTCAAVPTVPAVATHRAETWFYLSSRHAAATKPSRHRLGHCTTWR